MLIKGSLSPPRFSIAVDLPTGPPESYNLRSLGPLAKPQQRGSSLYHARSTCEISKTCAICTYGLALGASCGPIGHMSASTSQSDHIASI